MTNAEPSASNSARVRRGSTVPCDVLVVGSTSAGGNEPRRKPDVVSTEEPLEIRIGEQAVAVTMRTPGHDFELAVGYLLTEGILSAPDQLVQVRYCTKGFGAPQDYNIVTVDLRTELDLSLLRRATVTSSSCGLCGTDSIEHIASRCEALAPHVGPQISTDLLLTFPDRLRRRQSQFEKTGGLHGVGLFGPSGDVIVVREDVGRHNALDKVIGNRVLGRASALSDLVLVVSGRVSFEIVQKAAMARVAWIVAVGAPTSLAIDAAEELGITLAGFVNGKTANVYTHLQRLV